MNFYVNDYSGSINVKFNASFYKDTNHKKLNFVNEKGDNVLSISDNVKCLKLKDNMLGIKEGNKNLVKFLIDNEIISKKLGSIPQELHRISIYELTTKGMELWK